MPRIVLAPGTVEDCFYQTIRAFNLAELYQLPVILLTDQSLAQCTEGVPLPDLDKLQIVNRDKANLVDDGKFRRYAFTPNGVSPISTPGDSRGEYVAESAEHDERGRVNFGTNAHSQMTAKRFRKLETAENDLADDPLNFTIVDDEAKLAVMGWGSTQGAIHEAVLKAKKKLIRVKWMQCKMLNPLPRKRINAFLEGVDHTLVPELNYTSQFANLLRMNFAIDPITITKTEGTPFTPGEITQKIEELS